MVLFQNSQAFLALFPISILITSDGFKLAKPTTKFNWRLICKLYWKLFSNYLLYIPHTLLNPFYPALQSMFKGYSGVPNRFPEPNDNNHPVRKITKCQSVSWEKFLLNILKYVPHNADLPPIYLLIKHSHSSGSEYFSRYFYMMFALDELKLTTRPLSYDGFL